MPNTNLKTASCITVWCSTMFSVNVKLLVNKRLDPNPTLSSRALCVASHWQSNMKVVAEMTRKPTAAISREMPLGVFVQGNCDTREWCSASFK